MLATQIYAREKLWVSSDIQQKQICKDLQNNTDRILWTVGHRVEPWGIYMFCAFELAAIVWINAKTGVKIAYNWPVTNFPGRVYWGSLQCSWANHYTVSQTDKNGYRIYIPQELQFNTQECTSIVIIFVSNSDCTIHVYLLYTQCCPCQLMLGSVTQMEEKCKKKRKILCKHCVTPRFSLSRHYTLKYGSVCCQ